jgi:signal transduction histidine kinase
MAFLMSFEVLRYLDWVPVDFKAIRHYHVPLMLLAMGAAILESHVLAVRRTEQANLDLEERVAEKVREIEANQARVEEAVHEQARARERQRILTDMHEGLGASLIGLLRYAQAGRPDGSAIAQRVREALQEMKIAVDALQPHEGDLASVLGGLRYRLDGMIRETGVRMVWQVEDLPPVAGLGPAAIFALQRILLEAITNVLKHAVARQIVVTARVRGEDAVSITVEDDGTGFDAQLPAAGLGLASMRARAARAGAALEIRSSGGKGTIVEIVLPSTLARPPVPSAADASKTEAPGFIPAAGIAS